LGLTTHRVEPYYRFRAAVIPVLLLGTASGILGWHAADMWSRRNAARIAQLHAQATAQNWSEAGIRRAVAADFDHRKLIEWLEHPSSEVRQASAWAVGYTGSLEDCDPLVSALQSRDAETAAAAADAMWRLWLDAGPDEVRDSIAQARMMLDQGLLREAQISLNRAIVRHPDAPEPYNQRARIFMIQHDYNAAIEDCRRVIERLPNHFDARARMGECYLRLGRLDDAVYHYREALRIKPNLHAVWRRLAQIRNLPMSATDEPLSRT